MTNTKRRVVSFLVALTLILAIVPLNIFAATTGDENVVTISSLTELESFRDDVNNGNTYEGYTVSLTANIELSGEWTPIGNGSRDGKTYTGNAFKGIFNGNGNTITGLTVTSTDSSAAVGLFGVVDGGTIQNLVFENVSINTASKNAGSAIGLMVGGATADNIIVKSGSVVAADGVGGIVGRMTVSGTISNCSNSAAVEATSSGGAGGIVGKAYYTETNKLMTIANCTNTATVKSGYAAGGIVGLSAADITNCSNSGAITASTEAGGIVAEQVNRGIVSGNTNTADVIGEATAAGGIVGWVRYQTSITDYALSELIQVVGNKNSGSISKGEGSGSLGYGGIVGTVYNQAFVSDNENSAPSVTGGTFAAGVLGAAQLSADNLTMEGTTVTTSNNISTTSLNNITGNCVALDVYSNDSSFVAENNVAGISGAIFKIENGMLYVSYDTELNWVELGKVVGDDGADGENGANGTNGTDGKDGVDGADGKDGLGIAKAEINDNGELVVTYTDGSITNLGVIVGADGADGENGKDGADGKDGVDGQNGKDGVDGQNGKDGVDGENGKDGLAVTATVIGSTALAGEIALVVWFFLKKKRLF